MRIGIVGCSVLLWCLSACSFAVKSTVLEQAFDQFAGLYQQELDQVQGCEQPEPDSFKVCSSALRNDGNAPFILHHGQPTAKVFALFHGLSDSPFYLSSIAQSLHAKGHTVVVGLLPGHGKKQADEDMQDPDLANRWREHVAQVVTLSQPLGNQLYIGGFSTGGALSTEYALIQPQKVSGLLLFSGALALTSGVESITRVWGIQWVMKWLDGNYQTQNNNPFKYPAVARFAAKELMEVILSVRALQQQAAPNMPIWAAHSDADITTPIHGVESLLAQNTGDSDLFRLGKKFAVCHADLVLNDQQAAAVAQDTSLTDVSVLCKGPKANPLHQQMLASMHRFVAAH